MDGRQKAKIWRRVLLLTRDPEIADMAKQHFAPAQSAYRSLSPTAEDIHEKNQEKDGRVRDLVAIALALGAWWYGVATPEPNFLFGSLLLFVACFLAVLALWDFFSWKNKGRIASAICFLLLFARMDYSWYRQRKASATLAIEKTQAADRKEAFQSLTAHMEYEIGDDPVLAAFEYSNGSSLPLLIDAIEGYSNALLFGGEKYDVASFDRNHLILQMNGQRLESGGDGQVEAFLRDFLAPSGHIKFTDVTGKRPPISCADLLLQVDYRLESQPKLTQKKLFRFVTMPTTKGLKWAKESIESKTNFCTVRSLQKIK